MVFPIAIVLLFCGCSKKSENTEQQDYDSSSVEQVAAVRDSTAVRERSAQIRAELDYYLERHDEKDEGYDLVSQYARGEGVTAEDYFPAGRLYIQNIGRWRCMPRSGMGITRDGVGRWLIAMFNADSLVSGVRIDTTGVYSGRLDHCGYPTGHGIYRWLDGATYDGLWLGGLRNGFGFVVSPQKVSAGHWRFDRFLGEHMHYTPQRIYGIDIARYQHEKNGKTYAIDWRHMRIGSLGHRASSNQVLGKVDYPVSFVYIKSTEGISIKNQYFVDDYAAAHQHGIVVGAYHFFSTRQSATAQANYFVNNSRFRRGDLPPMLDVEPSDAMIKAMGGAEALFDAMRKWLEYVERTVGVRPIIYVNQRFVEKFLSQAPDLKTNYQLWVARYSAYKPDTHLTFWQLSEDGRVDGIMPEVDINVFNGYQSQWEQFLLESTVR